MKITIQNYKQQRPNFDLSKLPKAAKEPFALIDDDFDDFLELYTDSDPAFNDIRKGMDNHIEIVNKYLVDVPKKEDVKPTKAIVIENDKKSKKVYTSKPTKKPFDLLFTNAGGFTVVSNKADNYKELAHLSEPIKYFVKNLPKEVVFEIEYQQKIELFKKYGKVSFDLNDQFQFKFEKHLKNLGYDYGDTSQTGLEIIFYDKEKWSDRLIKLDKNGKEIVRGKSNKPSSQKPKYKIGDKFLNTTNDFEVSITEVQDYMYRISAANGKKDKSDDWQNVGTFEGYVKAGAYKPLSSKKSKKESPCDEAIQNFLEDQKEDREKAAAKRKRNKVKNALDQETLNFYDADFRLLRRFYNLVSKKTKVSFRSVQLLYVAFQKHAVARKVRKTSDLANLYTICNKKLTKLYEAIAPQKEDAKITFADKDVLEQLATLVKNKKVDYSISLINRIINIQGTAPEDQKVKRLIATIDNAIKNGKIDERSRLFDDIKQGKSTLKAYLDDKTEKIETKQYGLSQPHIKKKKTKSKSLGQPTTIVVDLSNVAPIVTQPDAGLDNPYTAEATNTLDLDRSKQVSVNTIEDVKADAALQTTPNKVIGLKSSLQQRKTAKPINYFNLSGVIAKFLGNLEKKHKESLSINISGPAGSMKTRFSFQFVDELLSDNLTVGFASLEEHYESALFRNKEDQYIKPQNLDRFYPFSDLPDTFEKFVSIVNQCDAFFTDSWQKLVEKYGNINYDTEFRKAIDGKILFTIFQETTDGKTRGGSKTTFDGDIILKVDVTPEDYTKNYVYAQKNRYETLPGAKYYIHDKKLITPQDEAAMQLPQSMEISLI